MQDVGSEEAELVSERLRRLLPGNLAGVATEGQRPAPAPGPPPPPPPAPPPGRGPAPAPARVNRPDLEGPGLERPGLDRAYVDGPDISGGPAAATAGAGLGGAGAFNPGRRGVKALAVVAAVVVLGAGLLAWRSRPQPEAVPDRSAVPTAASMAAAPAVAGDRALPASGPTAVTTEVVVTVAGKVRRAGLVRLPAGARVGDALDGAGGVLPGIDAALLNPARKVTDGELILVGVAAPPGVAGPAHPGPGAAAAGSSAGGVGTQPGGKVNLNSATLAHLDALPGVGPVLAQRILDHRERQGGFRSVADLRQVQGIGQARYEELKDLVVV